MTSLAYGLHMASRQFRWPGLENETGNPLSCLAFALSRHVIYVTTMTHHRHTILPTFGRRKGSRPLMTPVIYLPCGIEDRVASACSCCECDIVLPYALALNSFRFAFRARQSRQFFYSCSLGEGSDD